MHKCRFIYLHLRILTSQITFFWPFGLLGSLSPCSVWLKCQWYMNLSDIFWRVLNIYFSIHMENYHITIKYLVGWRVYECEYWYDCWYKMCLRHFYSTKKTGKFRHWNCIDNQDIKFIDLKYRSGSLTAWPWTDTGFDCYVWSVCGSHSGLARTV